MKQPIVLLIAALTLLAMVVIPILKHFKKLSSKKAKKKAYKPLANTVNTCALPEYKEALKKYRLLLAAAGFLFVTMFSSVAVVASRPTTVSVAKPEYENRDIMLCLDMSGSMNEYVKQLLQYFSELVKGFEGQRVGLTIFNSVSLTVAPLSDDYDMLSELFTSITENSYSYSSQLYVGGAGTSAIGRGVAGCVNSFDKLTEQDRSRSIILATDNYDFSDSNITLTQAANYAKRYDIAIYGLSTTDTRSQEQIDQGTSTYESSNDKEFREATLNTGGAYYAFSTWSRTNDVVVSDIVNQILEQAAARYEGAETLVYSDSPLAPIIIATISAAALAVIIWRLGL